ncbi:U7 snRNA-associated Sm-like protein LSm10 [Centruroides vittatus]|uniref:U7 snRNA-associated Sm-like protein LSm10 n=1 Tax=Centruroides vittatus TaxID=120091 RepID=UPI00350FE3F0
MSLREKARSCKTLVCLLQALTGKITTVELRNECAITGRIDSVDGYMNIHMSEVIFNGPSGEQRAFSSFFIQGKQIRFVQIPDEVNIIQAIQNQLNIIRRVNISTCRETLPQKKLLRETRTLRNQIIKEKTERNKSLVTEAGKI